MRWSWRGAAILAAAMFAGPTAQAATIPVPPNDAIGLINAINTANGTAAADTLELSGTYAFAGANNWWYGPNALPAITTDITITGTADGTIIQASNATRLRLFYVANNRSGLTTGTLRLRNLEVRNGIARGGSSG